MPNTRRLRGDEQVAITKPVDGSRVRSTAARKPVSSRNYGMNTMAGARDRIRISNVPMHDLDVSG
jgi:hypothetical protein